MVGSILPTANHAILSHAFNSVVKALILHLLQHVPLADLGLAVRVPATVSMLLSVICRLGVSVRQGGLDPTATKVTM